MSEQQATTPEPSPEQTDPPVLPETEPRTRTEPAPGTTTATTESDRERPDLRPYRTHSIRRYALAIGLFALGLTILLAPIPGIGRVGAVFAASPAFLILVVGWYLGRSGLATLAHILHRRRHRLTTDGLAAGVGSSNATATPSVSILIPAYNEARDIAKTIESVENLEYDAPLEVVVVDDGSSDGTWYVLQALADAYPTLRVFTKENGGAASARNTALEHAEHEVVISLDADTELHPTAITEIARHFTSEEIVAVGGNVSVANMDAGGWWAKMQVFDYALAMEIGRMFQSMLGYVLCLSGAFGAFRRETLIEAGGWNENWLYSDDFEVSVRMQERGTVKYSPTAQADTIVPTSIRGWFDQRKAWAQRGISVMLLHSDKQLRPSSGVVGMIGLPLRAILTAFIIIETASFLGGLATGATAVGASLVWVAAVALLGMTAFCSLMLGVLTVLLVDEKPIQYAPWAIGYLLVYRPLHAFARLYGFSQALWWEATSLGGSLRSSA